MCRENVAIYVVVNKYQHLLVDAKKVGYFLANINIVVHIILLSKTPDKSRSSSVEVINVINLIKFL